jgi:hypothetical protein
MKALSSVAPYLTAYRKGIIFAKPEFTFVADESIIPDLSSNDAGIAYPGANPKLIDYSNEHTFKIHEELNKLLANLANIDDFKGDHDLDNLKILKEYYDNDPINIALVGSAEMIPQYYYYDTPDANSIKYGWDVASDFIYGNIDPYPRNDKIQNNHPADHFISKDSNGKDYDEHYPNQENIVGRVSGWDVQDVSALIARTVFYENVIDDMDEDWKNTAVVQTGSGTDFQRIPIIDTIRKLMGVHGSELVLKWPTGASHFENLNVQNIIKKTCHFSDVRSTENHESMRVGFSSEVLNEINKLGLLNRLLFPKVHAQLVIGEDKITGGKDQEESNFIYSFGHGQPMGYGHGDVQVNSIGFRPILLQNFINRITFATGIPQLGSALAKLGSYDVRYLENMDFGPSVIFINSCYIGRIDGWYAPANSGQTYLHSGVNALIASSRGSPGPGYLDARKKVIGFGLQEYLATKRDPSLQSLHFGGLMAGNIFTSLGKDNVSVGMAFRIARNSAMEDADSEFFWAPPLDAEASQDDDSAKCMEKKYTCQLEFNLFGDPAFNPYEPRNEGRNK